MNTPRKAYVLLINHFDGQTFLGLSGHRNRLRLRGRRQIAHRSLSNPQPHISCHIIALDSPARTASRPTSANNIPQINGCRGGPRREKAQETGEEGAKEGQVRGEGREEKEARILIF